MVGLRVCHRPGTRETPLPAHWLPVDDSDVVLLRCPAVSVAGGAICTLFQTYLYVYDCTFTRCTATMISGTGQARAGAVMATVDVLLLAFVGCTFTECAATSIEGGAFGGAVMTYRCNSIFSDCTFTGCRVASATVGPCYGGVHLVAARRPPPAARRRRRRRPIVACSLVWQARCTQ